MSILNNKQNMFVAWIPKDFFYPEVRERWIPVINRLKLPYTSVEDFVNATIQNVTFPEVLLNLAPQPQSMFPIKYRGGKELEPTLNKNLTITFKLGEGYIGYWMFFEQIEAFQKYADSLPFWPSIHISFLDHHGFELMVFEFQKIVPLALSQINLNYSTVGAEFNTFTLSLVYNRYKITRRLTNEIYTAGVSD